MREPDRDFGGAAGTGAPRERRRAVARAARTEPGGSWRRRNRPGSIRKRRWNLRAASSNGLQARAHTVGEEHAHVRAELAGLDERRVQKRRLAGEDRSADRQMRAARGAGRRSWSAGRRTRAAAGRQYRTRSESRSSWQRKRAAASFGVEQFWRQRRPKAAPRWLPWTKRLKALRIEAQARRRSALGDRTGAGAQASPICVSRRDRRKELNMPAAEMAATEETDARRSGRRRRSRRSRRKSARKIEALGPVNRRRSKNSRKHAALRVPEHPAPGFAGFDPRHGKGDSGAGRRIAQTLQGSLRR